ncbi:gliding motility-associated protein GldE [soil metagenome]
MDYHSVIEILPRTLLQIPASGTTILIFLVFVLFVISFLVAGSEVAFFSLTYKDINMLKTKQRPSYRRIVTLLESPKTLLAAMLITNSLVNIGIILISNVLMDQWLPVLHFHYIITFIIKVVLVTALLVMFGEVLPKVWATHHKIWFASSASLVIEIFNSIFYKISTRLVSLSDRIERNFGHGNRGIDHTELDYAIDLLPEHEATNEEKQILKGIRKFGNTTVKQTMRTRLDINGIEYNTSFADVIKIVEEMHYSRLPVFKNNLDEIVGILHTKDLLPYLIESSNFDWHDLIRSVFYVHEQKLIEDLLQEFRTKRMHFAVVVDEFGGTSGIVTLEDIMEEIIGEIQDEFDDEQSVNKKIDDFTYIFEGKTMINDVCKVLGLPVETFDKWRGESDSVGGLVLEIAGNFPQPNDEFIIDQYTFIPIAISRNRIEKIKILINNAVL